jgi:hydrogenase 3 maturation protease
MPSAHETDFRQQLEDTLHGRVCLMGVGNCDYGDDAFGVNLALALLEAGTPDVIVAGCSPDRYVGAAVSATFDHLIFLDAVEFGGTPGSVVFLDAHEIGARYPPISTHKISLGVLAKLAESNGITKTWLLGVQPESLKEGSGLSPTVRQTMGVLLELLFHLRTREGTRC